MDFMRKTLAIILCLSMIFSAISCFAAVDSGYKTVLETVKSRIPDTDKFDDFSANQSINNGIKTYSFSWHNSDTDEMLGIEVLENGIITRLNFSSKADVVNEKAMSDISRDEALKKAISAFEKINPEKPVDPFLFLMNPLTVRPGRSHPGPGRPPPGCAQCPARCGQWTDTPGPGGR